MRWLGVLLLAIALGMATPAIAADQAQWDKCQGKDAKASVTACLPTSKRRAEGEFSITRPRQASNEFCIWPGPRHSEPQPGPWPRPRYSRYHRRDRIAEPCDVADVHEQCGLGQLADDLFAEGILVPVACDFLSLVGVRQVIKTVRIAAMPKRQDATLILMSKLTEKFFLIGNEPFRSVRTEPKGFV